MKVLQNVSLRLYSTMRLGGSADFLVEADSAESIVAAEKWAEDRELPVRMIGQGSNIIWRDEGFKGLLIINKVKSFKKLEENESHATYRIGAGEYWDEVVARTVELGLQGIECLSLIPGTVGATPVQNVGAYGQDISQTLTTVEAYDRMEKAFVTIFNQQCAFGYRTSRFKTVDAGRFLITHITLRLNKAQPKPPFYDSLQRYLEEQKITDPSLTQIRNAVITIRQSKLPDPHKIANNGSFFANPIVDQKHYKRLKSAFKHIIAWELPDKSYKLSAAWLVEQAGFRRGKRDSQTGMAIWKHQALVLVNEKAKSTQDLLLFQQKITDRVQELFDINLEREPELLP